MSMIDGLRNVLGINQDPEADSYVDDNEEDDIFPGGGQGGSPAPEEAYPTQETAKQHSNKVVNINATTQLQVVLVKPERFDDAAAIADQLNAKRTVVLNLESTNKEVSRRATCWTSWRTMASSSDTRTRGFVPPQNEDERFLMRRVEELCRTAMQRGIPRATGFLSDREQALAQAALNREGCDFARFQGGWPDAERKVLCIEPPNSWPEEPVAVLHFTAPQQGGSAVPGHRDYLGAILGLGLDRACLGDILPDPADARSVYAFVLEDKADFIASNLTEAGRSPVHVESCDAVPEEVLRGPERQTQDATVPSLRADTVLAAMMHTSRSIAAQAIQSGRVEVNHVPLRTAHEDVFEGDIFTVRGVGRYRLVAIGGKSRKDRIFITFYQY